MYTSSFIFYQVNPYVYPKLYLLSGEPLCIHLDLYSVNDICMHTPNFIFYQWDRHAYT